ncbi:cadherin domain-containing protein, partial [Synechocystis sp. FACHB-383]|nr:cadherin domain-containing protein [Synechocystis sp. FACHB-383]
MSGGGAGAGLGGAIFIRSGSLTLDNTKFEDNRATGGVGANNGKGLGGAIFAVTDDLKNEAGVITAPTVLSLGILPTFTGNTAPDNGGDSEGSTYDDNNIFGTIEIVPSLSINDVQVNEDAGTATFTVSLSSPALAGGVTFDIATANNTATAGEDYTVTNLTGQTIAEGKSTYTFEVDIEGGNLAASEETFFVNITNITGAIIDDVQGIGTIINVNEAPTDVILDNNQIEENIDVGSGLPIGALDITDPDATGNNNVLTIEGTDAEDFEIRNGNQLFFVGATPDFETKPGYEITVKSTDDNGGFPLVFTKDLTINVVDVNEVPTNIAISNNKIDENINTSGGIKIATVTITDPDISGNNNVLNVEGSDAGEFEIRNGNELFFIGPSPDFETKPSYEITIKSTDDNGGSLLVFTENFTITVNNLDEIAPTITSGGIATPIDENSGAGQVVYTVTSTDIGDITTGSTSYSLKEVDDFTAFTIDSTSGAVKLTDNPNFEAQSNYKFTIVATDAANNTSEQVVNLAINNLDEVAPTITSSDTATPIDENSGAGQVIYQVTADDSADISGGVTFGLKPGDDATSFSIDSTTGEVTLTEDPDFETQSSYKFTVTASDGVNSVTEQVVNLAINNLDEVAPIITSGNTAKAINENSGAGQVIYQVTADDSADISGGVTFGLKPGDDATSFSIDSTTGKVKLIGNPDFETQSSYKFTVTASDGVNPATEQLVNLAINNLDEVAPIITSGNIAKAINENSGAGQIIYQVTADDSADISTGVTFGLKPGDDASSFAINPTTGEVTLTEDPDFETQSSYKFTVTASDGVNSVTEQVVNLTINNLDEVAPIITSGNIATPIDENSGAGQVIYQATADDSADISGGVTFGLKPGDDATSFSIDSTTGKVKLIGNPDFETQSSYKFTVTASDGVNSVTEQVVNLAINNLDEIAPTITSGDTATPIDENSGAGQVIYQATADDSADISGGVTFGLKPGDDATSFSIDSTTGKVTLIGNPDFETQSSYKFTVTASDGVNPVTEQVVNLTINNL